MSTDNEELLDIFVGVRPSPNFLNDVDKLVDEATKRIIDKFGSITVPSPRFSPPNVGGGGSGRGGGGSSGGPQYGPPRPPNVPPVNPPAPPVNPPTPPGGNAGGGNTAGQNIRVQFTDAIRAAEDLQRTTDRVYDTINRKSDPLLANQFELAKNELEDILVLLRRASQDRSLPQLRAGIDRLNSVRSRVEGVTSPSLVGQTGGSSQRAQLVAELRELERLNRQKDQIRSTLAQSALQGLPFAEKMDLRAINAEIRKTQVELDGLIRGFNGTEQSLEQVIEKFLELNRVEDISTDLRERLQKVYSREFPENTGNLRGVRQDQEANLQSMGRSFNTLTNNAYQFGQAIEDFAVGYSLNGFAGGIRGAANNVAFLLNDFSRLEIIQDKLGKKTAQLLGLYAGIGSALAITVLPALVDWLESLNDIETQFEDISRRIKSDFDEVEFNVKLEADERAFNRSIRRTEELKSAIEALRDASEEASDKNIDLTSSFAGFSSSGTIKNVRNQAKELQAIFSSQGLSLSSQIDAQKKARDFFAAAGNAGVFDGIGAQEDPRQKIASDIKSLESQLEIVDGISKSSLVIKNNFLDAIDKGAAGIFDSSQLKQIVDAFDDIDTKSKNISSLDLSDPSDAEGVIKTLDAMRGVVDTFRKASLEIDSANRKIAAGLDIARQKASEFAQEQILITKVINDSANEEVLFAFETIKTVNSLAAAIEKARTDAVAAAKATGANPDLINEQADALREGLRIETINNILLRQKDIRKQIADAQDEINKRDGESQLTTLDKISQDLIKAQFSVRDESIEENTKKIEDLTEQLRILDDTIKTINTGINGPLSSERQALMSLPIGAGPSAMNLANMIDFSAMSVVMRDAVSAGVREAMAGQQKQVVDELKGVNDGVRKINVGAQ